MTVAVGIRVPGDGVVFVVDGRYSNGDDICTDSAKKWFELGSTVGVWAGSPGGLWVDLEEKQPRNWPELRERLSSAGRGREFDVLVYDRPKDRLVLTDQQGDMVLVGNHCAIGCGHAYAMGVLDASKPPPTLEAAAKLALKAVKVACKRNVFCGGRIRTVIVRGKRGEPEVR